MQARSERTRRRLVRAGARMFDRNGYASASLEQIADAAGVTKGALYFHFASKDGLADAVQEQAHAVLRDFVHRQREAGVPAVQSLIDTSHWLTRVLHEDPVVRAGLRITDECTGRQPPVADVRQAWTSEVLRLVTRARKAGELREHLGAQGPETALSAAVCGLAVLSGAGEHPDGPGLRVAALWEFLLPALVPAEHVGRYDVHSTSLCPRPAEVA
ncbi:MULTISPECIES: ScbR family autoregulator-binding transcription factor [unclassified Streptomyces]|uniref:ScbR family autoregulator-binding transcription factor n=1 Tax=unclassified Streptomyces TaxID=2593676 RepID=UPI00331B06F3